MNEQSHVKRIKLLFRTLLVMAILSIAGWIGVGYSYIINSTYTLYLALLTLLPAYVLSIPAAWLASRILRDLRRRET